MNESFDFVFTMDFLGHVEFRHKDKLIGEMARVTRAGGSGHHGVETGPIDYLNCNPTDERDAVRQYVYVDGHIGAELGEEVCHRFTRHFSEVKYGITRLYPFKPVGLLAECFEEDFQQLVKSYEEPRAIELANIIIGRLNTHFLKLYERIFGPALRGYEVEPHITEEHRVSREAMLRSIAEHNEKWGVDFVPLPWELFRPTFFTSLTVRK